jgi:hypothetical protein
MECVVNNMKNPDFRVGVITPPDSHYKPILYSDDVATQDFCRLNKDIYEGKQKARKLNDKQTPKSVFVALGLSALALGILLLKKFKH